MKMMHVTKAGFNKSKGTELLENSFLKSTTLVLPVIVCEMLITAGFRGATSQLLCSASKNMRAWLDK